MWTDWGMPNCMHQPLLPLDAYNVFETPFFFPFLTTFFLLHFPFLAKQLIMLGVFHALMRLTGVASETAGVCQSQNCLMAAAAVLHDIDTTADPCTDFYQYTCTCRYLWIGRSCVVNGYSNVIMISGGGWMKSHQMADDQTRTCFLLTYSIPILLPTNGFMMMHILLNWNRNWYIRWSVGRYWRNIETNIREQL